MKKIKINAENLAWLIVLATGLYALRQCVPGFRPKHVRDIIVAMLSQRGLGTALFFTAAALLIPASIRLKKLGAAQTIVEGFFVSFGGLLILDSIFEVGLRAHALAAWVLRLAYVAWVFWGFQGLHLRLKDLRVRIRDRWMQHWRGLPHWSLKVFGGLVLFFLIRQEMQVYIARSIPFGDEISWWWTASEKMMNEGYLGTILHHPGRYHPGVPWLITLHTRLLGVVRADWLYAYPLFVIALYLALIFEVATTSFGFWAGLTTLFFVFLACRDLHHLIGVTFYAEAICGLLTAVAMAHVYRAYMQSRKRLTDLLTLPYALGLGAFTGFCMVVKPPLSSLAGMSVPIMVVLFLRNKLSWKAGLTAAGLYAVSALTPLEFWKLSLTIANKHPEYEVSVHEFIRHGVNLWVPLDIASGLLIPGSPQAAYTMGLIAALLIAACMKNKRLIALMAATVVVYWGFILGLYGTLWQGVETGSAGRYLAHAALACVLIIAAAPKLRV